MGKIRGWKKIGKYSWKNPRERLILRVVKQFRQVGYDVTLQREGYPAAIVFNGEGIVRLDQAEKFAVRYMKAHPGG